MKNQIRQRKPIPFSWRSWDEMMQKWSLTSVWVSFSWERNGEDSEQSQKFEGKTEKVLKTVFETQNTCFSRLIQVARVTRQNTSSKKIWKNLLSVFCDWKSHSWGSRELSQENLCIPLATRPFTREQVTETDPRARGCSKQFGWPATESPKQGNSIFEIF